MDVVLNLIKAINLDISTMGFLMEHTILRSSTHDSRRHSSISQHCSICSTRMYPVNIKRVGTSKARYIQEVANQEPQSWAQTASIRPGDNEESEDKVTVGLPRRFCGVRGQPLIYYRD
ncbi:hypothetical protein LOK49_LG05G01310 [Camellia lanceoleosa]|uniref:Uncharacterized protein n=1 Tax=Camellia lanceoleosa TaxID=1840588 RepID=A0ACC0HQ54_9ERIC|nr:hypothetical protein LOK49_LG05G01310 [Camellia lanceoleosa]